MARISYLLLLFILWQVATPDDSRYSLAFFGHLVR